MPDTVLDLRNLKYALAVAEHGSFRRAADVLSLPQSTVSRRILALEARVGTQLFVRHPAGVQPTLAGRRFLGDAAIAMRQFGNAISALKSLKRGDGGDLRIGLFASLSGGFVKLLFEHYVSHFPDVTIHLDEGTAQSSTAGVLNGRLDLAFVTGEPVIPGCDTFRIWEERLFIVLPTTHPLGNATTLSWNSIREERFIVASGGRGPEIEDHIIARLSAPGFRPDVVVHAVSRGTLINMVSLGFGVALVTESAVNVAFGGVLFRPLDSDREYFPGSAVWLAGNTNPALKPLLKMGLELSRRKA